MVKNTYEIDMFHTIDNYKKSRYMEEYLIKGFIMREVGYNVDGVQNLSRKASLIMRHCGFAGQNNGLYSRPIRLPSGGTYQVTREDLEAFLNTMQQGESHLGKHRLGTQQSQPLYDFIVKRANPNQTDDYDYDYDYDYDEPWDNSYDNSQSFSGSIVRVILAILKDLFRRVLLFMILIGLIKLLFILMDFRFYTWLYNVVGSFTDILFDVLNSLIDSWIDIWYNFSLDYIESSLNND